MCGAAATIALLQHDDRKGGRGRCYYCGQLENNVSYHEAWECPKRVREAPDWLVERMDKLSKLPPATIEEVKIQLAASEAQRKLMDDILKDVPVVSQAEIVRLLT